MTYQDWTYKDVRYRIVEAIETARSLPRGGPKTYGVAWPEYIGMYPVDLRVRRIPSAGALSRMEETFAWMNDWLDESSRKIVHDYADVKSTKGKTITGWCQKNGWMKDTFENAVRLACQRIANELNRKQKVRLTIELDRDRQNLVCEEPEQAGESRPQRQPRHMMMPGAKPKVDRSPEAERAEAKYIEKLNAARRKAAMKREARRKKEAA